MNLYAFIALLILSINRVHSNDLAKQNLLNNYWDHLFKQVQSNQDNNNCANELLFILNSLTTDRWAQAFVDSSGKIQSGLLRGNINALGQFDQCISIKYSNENRPIRGKYCMAQFPITGIFNPNDSNRKLIYKQSRVGNLNRLGLVFNLAVCIPDVCSGFEFQSIIQNALDAILVDNGTKIIVEDGFCSTVDGILWDWSDWFAFSFYIFFALLILASTCYDAYKRVIKKGKPCDSLVSFSMWTNTEKLFKINQGSLKCLNGIRSLTMFWIMLGHRFVATISYPSTSFLDIYDWLQTYGSMFIISATVAVDTFLFLSGVLLSYIFYKQIKKTNRFNIFIFYLHRILRLTPPLVALVLMQSTLFRHLGSGPFWPTMYQLLYSNCRKNWWVSVLYLQNYVRTDKMCPGHTWYLGVDMQIYILSPILLIPLWKNRKYGLINLAFWTLVSIVTLFTIVFMNRWPASPYPFIEGFETRETGYYIATHMRIITWIIGFAFGYYLHTVDRKPIKISKITVAILWIASLATMLAVVLGMQPLQDLNHKFNHWEDSTYNCFARSAWVLSLAWIVFACIKGYGGPVNWFLSLNLWEILGRLSYTMYLFHLPLQSWFIAMKTWVPTFKPHLIMFEYFGDLVLTTIVAYFMSMAFEFPVVALEKILLHKEKRKTDVAPSRSSVQQ